jgi:hypothetical protein
MVKHTDHFAMGQLPYTPPALGGNSFPVRPIGLARATDCQRDGKVLPPGVYPLQMIAPAGVGVLQKPCDIFKISEIGLQKGRAGLLPGLGTVSSSGLSFLVGLLLHTFTQLKAMMTSTKQPVTTERP